MIVAIAVGAAWLISLTVLVLAGFRQISVLAARKGIDEVVPGLPMVGTGLIDLTKEMWPEFWEVDPTYVVLLSSGCAPCQKLLADIRLHIEETIIPARTIIVVGNAKGLARGYPELPLHWSWMFEPEAAQLMAALNLKFSPAALQIEQGIITGVSRPNSAEDLQRFVVARSPASSQEATALREAIDRDVVPNPMTNAVPVAMGNKADLNDVTTRSALGGA
jgi:hypothetical protein